MKAKYCFIFLLFTLLTAQTSMAQIEGYWKGQIDLGTLKLEMAFDIKAIENASKANSHKEV